MPLWLSSHQLSRSHRSPHYLKEIDKCVTCNWYGHLHFTAALPPAPLHVWLWIRTCSEPLFTIQGALRRQVPITILPRPCWFSGSNPCSRCLPSTCLLWQLSDKQREPWKRPSRTRSFLLGSHWNSPFRLLGIEPSPWTLPGRGRDSHSSQGQATRAGLQSQNSFRKNKRTCP